MKFINENEVVNGRVIIIFFFVCVFKRRNLFILCFEVLKKGVEIDRNFWMEIEKKCSFSFFGNGKIFGVRRRGDLYYFDLVLFFFFF